MDLQEPQNACGGPNTHSARHSEITMIAKEIEEDGFRLPGDFCYLPTTDGNSDFFCPRGRGQAVCMQLRYRAHKLVKDSGEFVTPEK